MPGYGALGGGWETKTITNDEWPKTRSDSRRDFSGWSMMFIRIIAHLCLPLTTLHTPWPLTSVTTKEYDDITNDHHA